MILVLGIARHHSTPNLGYRGAESPRWFDVAPKNSAKRHDAWAGLLSRWNCQSPVAHSCGLLNHPKNFHERMFTLNTKFDEDFLLYLLGHFECDGHTVHMLTSRCRPSPPTSTVKSSLFTHAHSSPLSLAARLHWCRENHSCYVNSVLTFSRQTSEMIKNRNKCFIWWVDSEKILKNKARIILRALLIILERSLQNRIWEAGTKMKRSLFCVLETVFRKEDPKEENNVYFQLIYICQDTI